MNLSIDNLTFRYGRRRPPVLDNLSVRFEEGGVIGLLGPNGAGKSTLLYLMAGLLNPEAGGVTYDDTPTFLRRPSVLSQIYLVPEEVSLPRMSLADFIRHYSPFYPGFDLQIMKNCLKEFDMFEPDRLDSLSMGQKKKIVLSFAFACNTPVLLMDEPTNGLDIPGKAAFRRLVASLASDSRLFLISTHQVRDLDMLLDRVMIMDSHRIILNESVIDLQRAFRFDRGLQQAPENAIYSLPSIIGVDSISANEDDSETEINLELLFDASLKLPARVNAALEKTESKENLQPR